MCCTTTTVDRRTKCTEFAKSCKCAKHKHTFSWNSQPYTKRRNCTTERKWDFFLSNKTKKFSFVVVSAAGAGVAVCEKCTSWIEIKCQKCIEFSKFSLTIAILLSKKWLHWVCICVLFILDNRYETNFSTFSVLSNVACLNIGHTNFNVRSFRFLRFFLYFDTKAQPFPFHW